MTYEVQNRSLPSSFWVYTHGKHLAISMCFIFTDSTYSCHPQATKFISLKSMRVQGSKLKARRWPNLELDDCCTKRDLWWLHVTMKTVLDGFTRRVVESDGSDAEVVLALDPVWSRDRVLTSLPPRTPQSRARGLAVIVMVPAMWL